MMSLPFDAQFFTLLTDLALGGMAYRLARKLSLVQEKQTIILENLVHRVEQLEINHHPQPQVVVVDRRLGFSKEEAT